MASISEETAGDKPEEGGDDVKSSWPLRAGLHTCYNGGDSGLRTSNSQLIPKSHLSSDCTLQLECMKSESLVIVDQHATVNMYLSLVLTARHALEIEWPPNKNHLLIHLYLSKVIRLNHKYLKILRIELVNGCLVTGAKS